MHAADELCAYPGRVEFLGIDLELVRALEDTLAALPPGESARRARVAARLALELRGDPRTLDRRRALIDEARAEAAGAADPAAAVAAELAGVHALWEPGAAHERLSAADEAVRLARDAHLDDLELDARMARVDTLLGLGRLGDAEIELGIYRRLAPASDPGRRFFAASRQSTIALVRGRFEEAQTAADEVAAIAPATGRPDAALVLLTLRAGLQRQRGHPPWSDATLAEVGGYVARLPGHHFEVVLTRMLLDLGRRPEARAELARAMASLRSGRGPLWLGYLYEAAMLAAELGRDADREWLLAALDGCDADFATYTVWFAGSTHAASGALALALGRPEPALAHLDRAVSDLDAIGALPLAARARRLRAEVLRALGRDAAAVVDDKEAAETFATLRMGDFAAGGEDASGVWTLRREAEGWHLLAATEEARLPHSRGLEHLRMLLANPRHEIPVVVLEAGGGAVPGQVGLEPLDAAARAAYRTRLDRIEESLTLAEQRGDQEAALVLEAERAALVAELKGAVGLGGRVRRSPDATERARVNVTRSIRRAIERIAEVAPQTGLHLAASIRTGAVCRYEPMAGGPQRWRTG